MSSLVNSSRSTLPQNIFNIPNVVRAASNLHITYSKINNKYCSLLLGTRLIYNTFEQEAVEYTVRKFRFNKSSLLCIPLHFFSHLEIWRSNLNPKKNMAEGFKMHLKRLSEGSYSVTFLTTPPQDYICWGEMTQLYRLFIF